MTTFLIYLLLWAISSFTIVALVRNMSDRGFDDSYIALSVIAALIWPIVLPGVLIYWVIIKYYERLSA